MSRGFVCINCNKYTKFGHYVPPCVGDPGFFHCIKSDIKEPPRNIWIEVAKGVKRKVPNPEYIKYANNNQTTSISSNKM